MPAFFDIPNHIDDAIACQAYLHSVQDRQLEMIVPNGLTAAGP
jgi:hypothetical protein